METATLDPEVKSSPEPEAEHKTDILLISDRCDQCGAQAYVGVLFGHGDLMFCAHHFNKYQPKIEATAVKVVDERWKLYNQRRNVE